MCPFWLILCVLWCSVLHPIKASASVLWSPVRWRHVSTNTWTLRSGLVLIILSEITRYKGLFVSQYMRRLPVPDGTEGPSVHSCQHASSQTKWSSMCVMTLGTFGVRPPACVHNSSPSQVLALIKHQFYVPTYWVNVWNNHVFSLSTNLVPRF
jgi:hypothetical protein